MAEKGIEGHRFLAKQDFTILLIAERVVSSRKPQSLLFPTPPSHSLSSTRQSNLGHLALTQAVTLVEGREQEDNERQDQRLNISGENKLKCFVLNQTTD